MLPSFTSLTLPLVIGVVEILVGTALLIHQPPPYASVLRRIPVPTDVPGAFFVLAGVVSLVLRIYRPWMPVAVRWAGRVVAALPLVFIGLISARLRLSAAAVTFLILAAAGLLFQDRDQPAEGRSSIETIVPVVLLIDLMLGAILLTALDLFPRSMQRLILPYRVPLAVVSLAGAAALAALPWIKRPSGRLAATLLASAPLIAFTVGTFRLSGWWVGSFHFVVLAAFLVAHPWIGQALRIQARAAKEHPAAAAFDRAAEGVVWAVILLTTVAGAAAPSRIDAVSLHLLVLLGTLITLIWYRLPPSRQPRSRLVRGIALFSVLGGAIVVVSGGLNSPLFFLRYLPILAASWSLPPQYIALPAGIGIAGVGVDAALDVLRGGLEAGDPLMIFRISGVLFVAVFAYLLASRAADQRSMLRREKQGLETIVRSMAEGLVVLDQTGATRVCNPAAEQLFNCRAADIVGKHLLAALTIQRADGRPFPDQEHPVLAALNRGRPSRQRVLAGRREGDSHLMALGVSPFSDLGTPGVICTFQDVRSEVEMERMREDFFHIASHEIRTPLTVIKGNAEIALDGSLGELQPGARHVLTEICDATDRLIRLVNDFLDAARVDQGKIRLSIDTGNITSLVRQVVDTMGPDARRKGLTLTYLLPDPAAVPLVMMDSEKVLQVLLNLVGNAIKYTTTGGIEIWHEQGEGIVETHIKDTGVGIAREHRPHLFERFSQAARGLTRQTGGSGLGLYISRTLADRMGGSVYLKESAPGEGSTFVFALSIAPRVPRIAVGMAVATNDVSLERIETR